MSTKVLKLKHLSTYVGPRVGNHVVKKGQTIRVDDERADEILENAIIDVNGEPVSVFIEVTGEDAAKPTYDISTPPADEDAAPPTGKRQRLRTTATTSTPSDGAE